MCQKIKLEIFFRLVKFWGANERNRNEDGGNGGVIIGKENENEINGVGEGGGGTMDHSAPAAFNDQGVNYLHVKANGVYAVSDDESELFAVVCFGTVASNRESDQGLLRDVVGRCGEEKCYFDVRITR